MSEPVGGSGTPATPTTPAPGADGPGNSPKKSIWRWLGPTIGAVACALVGSNVTSHRGVGGVVGAVVGLVAGFWVTSAMSKKAEEAPKDEYVDPKAPKGPATTEASPKGAASEHAEQYQVVAHDLRECVSDEQLNALADSDAKIARPAFDAVRAVLHQRLPTYIDTLGVGHPALNLFEEAREAVNKATEFSADNAKLLGAACSAMLKAPGMTEASGHSWNLAEGAASALHDVTEAARSALKGDNFQRALRALTEIVGEGHWMVKRATQAMSKGVHMLEMLDGFVGKMAKAQST
ncbi:MAG: hypothetical protein ACKVPX_04270 [Myxococcaceae bacterium]